jgi:hypothetical protein
MLTQHLYQRRIQLGLFLRFNHRKNNLSSNLSDSADPFQEGLSRAYGRNVTNQEADNARRRLRDFFNGLRRCEAKQIHSYLIDDAE